MRLFVSFCHLARRTCLQETRFRGYANIASNFALEHLGQLEEPRKEAYEPGQLFIHRQFGYRGIIMSAWPGSHFNRDNMGQSANNEMRSYPKEEGSDLVMYTVLTDTRDTPLCNPVLKPGITFLPDGNGAINSIYIISCMDYAFHADIVPFSTDEPCPIANDYLKDFFCHHDSKLLPTEHLNNWTHQRRKNLAIQTVHSETTDGIRITSVPFFMGRKETRDNDYIRYWRYLIRLENTTDEPVQLRERFWKVFSITGSLESVKGKGVVGVQPVLSPKTPVFQYHSHVQVQVPWAHMWGSFRFEKQSSGTIDVKIPAFPLCDKPPIASKTTAEETSDGN